MSNRKVSELLLQLKSAKDHGKNYIKVKPHLVHHLLRNRQLIWKNWFLERICQILVHYRVKIGRITQLLAFNPVELIFLGNRHVFMRELNSR